MGEFRVMFVIPVDCKDQNEVSPGMLETFNTCKMNGVKATWIKEDDNAHIDSTKTDFIVFQSFAGALYKKVKQSKSVRILSPLCLLHCLHESKPIPNSETPLLSLAMQDCCVVGSSLPKETKRDLKFKVQAMGGVHSPNLVSETTYLITHTVKSEKYIAAVELGIKVMLLEFVDALWDASATRAVHASDQEFQKYKCPALYNLYISTTGFAKDENDLPRIITEHGGKFKTSLEVHVTDVLVCKSTTSAKYKAAMKCKIDCVSEAWIHDSVARGYALSNMKDYAVKAAVTSTPTKQEFVDPNFSTMSVIPRSSMLSPSVTHVEETMEPSFLMKNMLGNAPNTDVFDNFSIRKAKLSGPYLDGCVVYAGGFNQEQNEKLCKIINFSGAIRCDSLNQRITHAIIGNPKCAELKQIKSRNLSCAIVNVMWLVDSMDAQKPMDTENYLISTGSSDSQSPNETTSSPLSKKGLNLLRTNVTTLEDGESKEKKPREDTHKQDDDLMKQYLNTMTGQSENSVDAALAAFTMNQWDGHKAGSNEVTITKDNTVTPRENSTASSPSISITLEESRIAIFANLKFAVVNYDQTEEEYMINYIREMQGTIVPKHYKGIPDYAVVPICNDTLHVTASNVVTHLWIKDCTEKGRLVTELEYYHAPFPGVCKVLDGLVLSMSGYRIIEKEFLAEVIAQLGGKHQECMSRTNIEAKETLATTHLISEEATGKKYNGAVKWGLPVVSKAWLFKCADDERLVDVDDFLIGASKGEGKSRSNLTSFKTPNRCNTPLYAQPSTSKDANVEEKTPVSNRKSSTLNEFQTPENKDCAVFSQVTPVDVIMERVRAICGYETPKGVELAKDTPPRTKYDHIETPPPPFGAFLKDPPPRELRKQLAYWIDTFPSPPPRRLSTPLSEIKRRYWANLNTGTPPARRKWVNSEFVLADEPDTENDNVLGTPKPVEENENASACAMNTEDQLLLDHMDKLENHLMSSGGIKRRSSMKKLTYHGGIVPEKESQPLSVGWDDNMDIGATTSRQAVATTTTKPKLFMLSRVDAVSKAALVEKLEKLGATTSSLANYDPSSTHLLCDSLNRNEKLLASMAAGLWVLHTSYVDDSAKAGKLLNEEDYEFGNPKAMHKYTLSSDAGQRASASYYWRQEINRRGYGAFHDIRAIVLANKKEPMVRVLQAGGAMMVDASPPFEDNVSATHCFLEQKNINVKPYIPLAQQGIMCVNTLYVNDFLNRTAQDINEYIIPAFHKYY